jgi:hypothetical protein
LTEQWKPIPGFEGVYEVSDLGNVRSLARTNAQGKRYKGKLLRVATVPRTKVRQVVLFKDGVRHSSTVHKLVLTTFVGPAPEGQEVVHLDGDSSNNALTNLKWGFRTETAQSLVRRGTHVHTRKERCPRGHLLEEGNLTAFSKSKGWRSCLACSKAHKSVRDYQSVEFKRVSDLIYKDLMGEQAL